MSYKNQTPFYVTDCNGMVYSLKQDGWNQGEPRMVNDVWITINAPAEHKAEIAETIKSALNNHHQQPTTLSEGGYEHE